MAMHTAGSKVWHILCLCSILFLVFQSVLSSCPEVCNCTIEGTSSKHYRVVCANINDTFFVNNSTQSLYTLPSRTTHLLLIFAALEDTTKSTNVSFTHLDQLQVLLLDTTAELAGIAVEFPIRAFCSRLRVFKSRVPLHFSMDTFSNLKNLEELVLTGTNMDWNSIPDLTNGSLRYMSRLTTLSLRRFSRYWNKSEYLVKFYANKLFASMPNNSVYRLDLSRNAIHSFSLTFKVFKNLKYLDVSYNFLNMPSEHSNYKLYFNLYVLLGMCVSGKHLELIDISRQGKTFSRDKLFTQNDLITEGDGRKVYTPQKEAEEENRRHCGCHNPTSSLHCQCFQFLRLKSFSASGISPIQGSTRLKVMFSIDVFLVNSSVEYVDLSDNRKWHFTNFQKASLFGAERLIYLNIQNNGIGNFHESFFRSMKSVRVLLLAGNDLYKSVSHNTSTLFFDENRYIETLDLSCNGLTGIPHNLFNSMNFLKNINLSQNSLSSLNINLTGLHLLEYINMSDNMLSHVSKEMREELDLWVKVYNKSLTLDLTKNRLLCGCGHIDFVKWIQTTRVKFHNGTEYSCGHPYQGFVAIMCVHTDGLHNFCFPSIAKTIVLSVVTTSVVILITVIAVSSYCKRWRIRYWWYLTQKGWSHLSNNVEDVDFNYDVFVAYNWQDSFWVHGHLLQEMEEKRGLRLCIHQRDFIPGEVLEELIVDKIQKSRKTLLVLTPHFVSSNWCHFELHMARNQLFDKGRDVLVLVILKPLPPGSVNGTLYQLLKKKLYLEWPEDAEGHALFWNKLADALRKDERDCRPFD